MPTISAVVLAYNRPQMLEQALASVAAQRRAPDEVLVIDDHSEPPLRANGVRLIRHATNQGAGAAAATGLIHARGNAIAFLNDDDAWSPDFLETLEAALEAHPGACIAFCDHSVTDHRGVEQRASSDRMSASFGRTRLHAGQVDLPRPGLVDLSIPTASFALVRREVLTPELLRAGGEIWDYFVTVGAVLSGRPGIYVARRMGWYRLSLDGVTAGWRQPGRGISARARRVAAARLAFGQKQTRGVRGTIARQATRCAVGGLVLALRSGDPRLLGHFVREMGQALLAPMRPPRRRSRESVDAATTSLHRVLRMVTGAHPDSGCIGAPSLFGGQITKRSARR